MDDKRLKEMIQHSGENIEAPESLKPENIRKQIGGEQPSPRKKRYKRYVQWGAVAAAFVLVIFGCVTALSRINSNDKKEETTSLASTALQQEQGTLEDEDELATEDTADLIEEDTSSTMDTTLQGKNVENYENVSFAFKPAQTYADVYAALESISGTTNEVAEYALKDSASLYATPKSDIISSSSGEINGSAGDSQSADYSTTNLRVANVDEGDVIKTDGIFLYVMKRTGKIRIIEPQNGDMNICGTIELENMNETPEEIYVDDTRLYLIASGSESAMNEESSDVYSVSDNQYVKLYTYDITTRSNPKQLGEVSQEGYYRTSRKNGSQVYLFSEYMPTMNGAKEINNYIPSVLGERLLSTDIYIPEYVNNSSYLVMTSVDGDNPNTFGSHKAVVSAAGLFYVSEQNIYICNNDWNGNSNQTQILKFHYADGEITAAAVGDVKGYVNDSFSIDEYNGYLRVVTTDYASDTTTNALFILDESLDVYGSILDVANGETIQSARFMGDTGYFVTYKNMDPLFTVDLSNPASPTILGELKITGFSSYLHFYGENKLLGIGYETDPDTGETKGIKLSMYDISDPSDVTEIDKSVIKDQYDASVFSNYKSIMLEPSKNVIGFVCGESYMIFTYNEEEGFQNTFVEKTNSDASYYGSADLRGCYIDKTFYLVTGTDVRAYDMSEDYRGLGKLDL